MPREERSEILDVNVVALLEKPECASQRHLSKPMMVSEGLAVHCNGCNNLLILLIKIMREERAILDQSTECNVG